MLASHPQTGLEVAIDTSCNYLGCSVNYETLNRYVLIAIALFAMLLYIGLIYAGFAEFTARISKRGNRKKRSRNRGATRGLRNSKRSILP